MGTPLVIMVSDKGDLAMGAGLEAGTPLQKHPVATQPGVTIAL